MPDRERAGETRDAGLELRPPGRRRLAVLALPFTGAAVGVAIGLALHRPAVAVGVAIFAAVLAAGRLLLAGVAARERTPILRIADDGLTHRSMGFIPWSEVNGVRTDTSPIGRTLHIEVADPNYMLPSTRSSFVRRHLPDYPTIEISEAELDMPLENVHQAITAQLSKRLMH